MSNKRIFFLIFGVIILFLQGCDTEKYFSSSLSMVAGSDSTEISGYVFRYDNQKPVEKASVQFGYYRTETDSNGFFQMGITYNRDDNRNSVSLVIIQADKYIDYYGQTLILPVQQEYEFTLIWRVPIVMQAAFLFNPEEGVQKVIQAKIMDFEGIDDVDSVYTFFKFAPLTGLGGRVVRPAEIIHIALLKVHQIDDFSAYYQSEKFDRTIQHPIGWIPYLIFVTDQKGYRDSRKFNYFFLHPDAPIYPVEW